MNNLNWLSKSTAAAKPIIAQALAKQVLIDKGLNPDGTIEPASDLEKLALWQRTSTTAFAIEVAATGAAILPKNIYAHDGLPRVDGWPKILKAIGWGKHRTFIADLLHDIEFQHHQSTNGRMNETLGRWERYGVRSVEDWRNGNFNYGLGNKHHASQNVPKRTFHNIKDRLLELGLIEAGSHLWMGATHLWIKPTDELSRILFDAGHWEAVRHLYVTDKPLKGPNPKSKGKPRGMSAKLATLDAELRATYLSAIRGEMDHLPKQARWAIWERLTKPIPMGKNYSKASFAEPKSYRGSRLYSGLMLQFG